ncbi:serine hydrolase domain-containing protein [Streptacidiphilus jiangxiensis]|uniref:CubicO group peptidase, beta-lactamase class C family n=1 Tax=Streptacidiphilus jiangxiensis TaxID=235985 RepID=A0A1H7JSP4_STRJI|nr:serine hydrolase domain-containing protein [Streptacidiphilus jiangxiensis]SEK77010.1 CubicO group peptidase, beta-lactamase class C family [Streptacidiphilus jiangxiensis]
MGWHLSELIAKYGVPGAQVAVLADGEIHDEAAGVLSLDTRVETTTDSVFKIGSITKLWTATLVQQLANDGVLDLDRPVRDHLPGFRLSDPAATETLTARQLLTHTGGIDGNHFTDTGRNDDAIERFVATLADADHLLPPGTLFSYSNSGYVVLGRLVELLRGTPFHDVLRERLVTPLGLTTVATTPYEAILHRAAVGHVETDGALAPTKSWAIRYFSAPSGSHLAMSARDLLRFVQLHLTDPALAAMRTPQLESVPDFGGGVLGWGLGWMLYRDGVVGHTGISKGQKAFLRVVPSAGVAVAVLTNSATAEPLAHGILSTVLGDLTGVETAPLPVPPANPRLVDVDRMCGTYRSTLYDLTLTVKDGRAFLIRRPRNERARAFLGKPEERVEVVRLNDSAVITAEPGVDGHQVLSLIGSDEHGRARFLHNGAAARRIS